MTNNTQTALAIRENRGLPVASINDIVAIGEWFSRSNIAGVRNPAEGFVVASHIIQKGMTIVEFNENYHVMMGRVTKRSDAMLADFIRLGGKYRIIERSDKAAEIEMENSQNKLKFRFTWDEALNEPFIYDGKPHEQNAELQKPVEKRTLKSKYRTPRSRMQMLWARVVSDACRVMDPRTNQGMYTPEEAEDFIDGEYRVVTQSSEPEEIAPPVIQQEPVAVDSEVVDAEFVEPQPQPQAETFDPFNKIPQTGTDSGIDFMLCPIPNCDATGRPWRDFPRANLEQALRMKHPTMQPGHYDAIRSTLAVVQ
jgi:hypothetical protein